VAGSTLKELRMIAVLPQVVDAGSGQAARRAGIGVRCTFDRDSLPESA